MEMPPPVTQIGKYEVLAEIGRGGMGVVYRAEDKFIGREVAIKTLVDATPELRERFAVEARSGVLNHQNIVTVYDFGEQDGNPFIVMEFVQGESLDRVLRKNTLTLVDKLDIVVQVCKGIGYAHQKGVVHRDIKPANIMIQPDGNAKIVDFGIARLESSSGQTATGAVIGTYHYVSPERLKGEPSDGRGDIWATGVMLYLMLTGFLPFAGEDISALHKIVNEPFAPLSDYLSAYPAELNHVMARALAKDPVDRYPSAEEMAADLDGINESLRREQTGEMLSAVKLLLGQDNLSDARPMLFELLRLDGQNLEIKKMLREVQDRLSRQQKPEHVEQMLKKAEDALLAQNYGEALDLYKQAGRIDPKDRGITENIERVVRLKEKFDKLAKLQQQAREARERNDLNVASHLIDRALQLDPDNKELVEERARLAEGAREEKVAGAVSPVASAGPTGPFRALDLAEPAASEKKGNFQHEVSRNVEDVSGGKTILVSSAASELLHKDSEVRKEQQAANPGQPLEPADGGSFTQMFARLDGKVEELPAVGRGPESVPGSPLLRPSVVLTFTSSSDPALTGKSVAITTLPFVIGRDQGVNLSINSDLSLSRHHCVIDWADGAYVIRDLDSSNGTWLNGRRLRQRGAVLLFGSVIRFSNTTALTFVSVDLLELPDLTDCLVGGRFRLAELLRSSKKSALYRADDQRLPQAVAVKVLSPDLAIYPGYLEQFSREAEIAARMRHPNIAKVIDFGVSTLKVEGLPEFKAQYVCRDFMKGGSLASRIAEGRFMKVDEVQAWLIPIADALQHAHSQGVVHGGLKTTSIVFDEQQTPYLTDFAVATYSTSADNSWLLGAPEFMAPEQWDGQAPSHSTDQYSLAVLVYYSLSGVRPYEGQAEPDVRRRNFERGPTPIHEEARRNGNVGVPAGASDVLARAMATEPEQRYPMIREFCSAFREGLMQVPVSREPSVFLSYRRNVSAGWASLFARELKHAKITAFVDVNRQDNALVFPQWLEKAISGCDVFICFLAKTTLASNWVCEEIRIAHRLGKLMIPVFQEDFKHPELRLGSDGSIETLLTYQGVTLLDRKNIYIDAAVEHLATMIRASLHK